MILSKKAFKKTTTQRVVHRRKPVNKKPNYLKMLKSWVIVAFAAVAIIGVSSLLSSSYFLFYGIQMPGYTIGIMFIAVFFGIIALLLEKRFGPEIAAAVTTFSPGAMFAFSYIWYELDPLRGNYIPTILGGIVFLCLTLKFVRDEKYEKREDVWISFTLLLAMMTCFTAGIIISGKYLL